MKKNIIKLLSFFAFVISYSDQSFASAQDVIKEINESTSTIPNILTSVAYIGGIALAVIGILKIKENVDGGHSAPALRSGIYRLLGGGALLALPMTLEAAAGSIGKVTGSQTYGRIGTAGYAEKAGSGTVGEILINIGTAFSTFPNLLTTFAYIAGIFMVIWAIFKFRDHVDAPQQVPMSDGVKRIIAGGAFLALPMMVEAVKGSLETATTLTSAVSGTGLISAPTGPAAGLDQLAMSLVGSLEVPMKYLITGFAYVAGIFFVLIGISRLTKQMHEGPRGPGGLGTLMTFICAGALLSSSRMMGAFSASMFDDATVSTNVALSPVVTAALTDPAAQTAFIDVIESIMIFVMLVGWVAFIRGWFVLKAVADGTSQASIAQAFTFLLGGALAVNLPDLINSIQTTMGVAAFGMTFS